MQSQKKELEASVVALDDGGRAALLRIIAEEQMLQQVLDWVRNSDLGANP